MTRWMLVVASALTGCASPACESRARSSHAAPAPSGAIDSALAPAEALRRFRAGLPRVETLHDGTSSRDALVARYVRAIERGDTNDLRAMMMNRAEFAYLYYPSSPHASGPTRQPPDVAWFLHIQQSQKGVTRVLQRHGGEPLAVRGHSCRTPPRVHGDNTVWDDCAVVLHTDRGVVERRLFGGIIERGGRYKLFSYANDY